MPSQPRPNVLRCFAEVSAAKGDGARQGAAVERYWNTVGARVDYLDERAAAFRFDQPHDAYIRDEVWTGIASRLARVRELVVMVRAWMRSTSPNKGAEAGRLYEMAERAAVNADLWIRIGRAGAEKRARRTQYQRAGAEANRKRAAAAARKYVRLAKRLRKDHPAWLIGSIVAELRRTMDSPLSPSQIRRHLTNAGLK